MFTYQREDQNNQTISLINSCDELNKRNKPNVLEIGRETKTRQSYLYFYNLLYALSLDIL